MEFKRGYWVKIESKDRFYDYIKTKIFRINKMYSTIAIAECLDEGNNLYNIRLENLVLVKKDIPVVDNLKFLAEA